MAGHKCAGDELLCESNSNTKKAKRQITKATFEKRQKEHEMEHQMPSWLQRDLDAKGTHVVSLYCAICRKYEANIQLLKNFRRDWIAGSTNQRTSNLIDHATSDVHKAAMAKLKVERSRARGESATTSTTIGRFLSSMDNETRERMAKKFDVCFMMAKESLLFTKYNCSNCWNSNFAMEVTWAQRTACQTQRRPSLATLV